jgi:hypothetical protein
MENQSVFICSRKYFSVSSIGISFVGVVSSVVLVFPVIFSHFLDSVFLFRVLSFSSFPISYSIQSFSVIIVIVSSGISWRLKIFLKSLNLKGRSFIRSFAIYLIMLDFFCSFDFM